ncbi:SigE family RNA polymerase sigma factor [Catellatospora citrea]|uniref:DNA-directed RNA polymerase sigma-70 factor n=1 Tax=Catellatospora citrea TaxID=53366 RepID=A0A8J3NX63_9ACTN|nr:SigE family RNA polymerase sigma factor [Catellatospora citrea]RKE07345.1 RNA polymerase sigma-70 factor (sigma-E family) [Catellatospora citrea]GIF95501.1 DNA-directed RNA polymerase sigma-70 factor [Catellatospora citrea]
MDDEGFRDFVHARLGWLSRIAYLLTGDRHAAEDLLQNTLIRLSSRWSKVVAAGTPDAYVRKLMYHEHVSAWRRARHLRAEYTTAELPDGAAGPDMAAETVRRLLLEQALAKLTRKQRAVIVLRYFEDLSEADAAEALGVSIGTVKSQTSHALARLRELAPELHVLVKEPGERAVVSGRAHSRNGVTA